MGVQIMAPLKPLNTIVLWWYEEYQGVFSITPEIRQSLRQLYVWSVLFSDPEKNRLAGWFFVPDIFFYEHALSISMMMFHAKRYQPIWCLYFNLTMLWLIYIMIFIIWAYLFDQYDDILCSKIKYILYHSKWPANFLRASKKIEKIIIIATLENCSLSSIKNKLW